MDCGVLARTSEGMGAFSNFKKVRWGVLARTSEGVGAFSNFKKVMCGLWSAGQNIRGNGSLQ